jgi:HD domain
MSTGTYDEPAGPTAAAALSLLRATSAPHLVNHCQRTFQFGLALAAADGQAVDPEVAYLAAVLHDLGLTDRFDGPDAFEDQGAAAAYAFLTGRGVAPDSIALITESIRSHLLVATGDDPRPEVAFVARGAGLDVVGLRMERLDPSLVAAVVDRYPRLDFKRDFAVLMHAQAVRKPHSTIGTYTAGGFLAMIQSAPFPT